MVASLRAQHALTLASQGLDPTPLHAVSAAAQTPGVGPIPPRTGPVTTSTLPADSSAPAPATATPSTSPVSNLAPLGFVLEFSDVAFLHVSNRQLISSRHVPEDGRAAISPAASAIKGFYRATATTTVRHALEPLPQATNDAVRTKLLKLVDILREFHARLARSYMAFRR